MRSSRIEQLITIGALARASGLTASALRFYGDCGLLVPAEVDAVTGYRYYTRSQCERAVLIRRLRGIDLSLETITEVLSGDPGRAERLLDAHVAELARRADTAARVAAQVKRALGAGRGIAVPAAELARAIGQVGTAAAVDDTVPVLAGVLLEADSTALTLTATDRYRLSTRTLAPLRDGGEEWSVVVEAAKLAPLCPWLDTIEEVVLAPSESGIALTCGEIEHHCTGIEQPFPDYRAVLDGLPPVRTRMLVARAALVELLEAAGDIVVCTIDASGLVVASAATTRLSAVVTGAPMKLAFRSTVLRSAVVSALGPDLMLDLAAPDQPVVVRSATDGDLTTLVMPTFVPSTEDPIR
ncbi:MerR family transcriptional regulator [Nocardia sp. NPDC050713]|uniref:DNA polymerase III subunit beta family protein n=1 Tax=Nocardia sp. NPDC050713 TaxID=3154511 RepID=UPI0034063C9C